MRAETREFKARITKLRAEAEENYQSSLRHPVFPAPDGGFLNL